MTQSCIRRNMVSKKFFQATDVFTDFDHYALDSLPNMHKDFTTFVMYIIISQNKYGIPPFRQWIQRTISGKPGLICTCMFLLCFLEVNNNKGGSFAKNKKIIVCDQYHYIFLKVPFSDTFLRTRTGIWKNCILKYFNSNFGRSPGRVLGPIIWFHCKQINCSWIHSVDLIIFCKWTFL